MSGAAFAARLSCRVLWTTYLRLWARPSVESSPVKKPWFYGVFNADLGGWDRSLPLENYLNWLGSQKNGMLKIDQGLIGDWSGEMTKFDEKRHLLPVLQAINHAELDGWDLKTGGLEGDVSIYKDKSEGKDGKDSENIVFFEVFGKNALWHVFAESW